MRHSERQSGRWQSVDKIHKKVARHKKKRIEKKNGSERKRKWKEQKRERKERLFFFIKIINQFLSNWYINVYWNKHTLRHCQINSWKVSCVSDWRCLFLTVTLFFLSTGKSSFGYKVYTIDWKKFVSNFFPSSYVCQFMHPTCKYKMKKILWMAHRNARASQMPDT